MTQEQVVAVLMGESPGVVRVRLLRQEPAGHLDVASLPEVTFAGYGPAVLEIFQRVRVLDPNYVEASGKCFFYQYESQDSMPYHGHAITVQVDGDVETPIGRTMYGMAYWMPPGKSQHKVTINFIPHAG